MIIPQVAENLSLKSRPARSEQGVERLCPKHQICIPLACPVCGGGTEIVGDPETLYCTNPGCDAQQVRALSHFVSRDALNIGGLSEQTIEKLVARGFVADFMDLFQLERFSDEIQQMEGFGKKSYEKLIQSIEVAKDVPLPNFIYALGIRHVGLANAKLLCAYFKHDAGEITKACKDENYLEILSEIKGFGEAISRSLFGFFSQEKNCGLYEAALSVLRIQVPHPADEGEQVLDGLTFVITGDVARFKNRGELQGFIEGNGGRCAGSVSAKTSFLINNDALSASSKNKKAAQLGVPILTEDDFFARFF